jgi:hypothetical protein
MQVADALGAAASARGPFQTLPALEAGDKEQDDQGAIALNSKPSRECVVYWFSIQKPLHNTKP